MRKKILFNAKSFLTILIFLFLMSDISFSQISNIVSAVRVGEAKEKTPLAISAELFTSENITSITIAYRLFGETEYKKLEMLLAGNGASVTIPSEFVQPPFIEYYLIINIRDGSTQTYPLEISQGGSPLQIPIGGVSQKDKEIIILSPNEGELLSINELLISISFIKASDDVDINKTKIFLNDIDITSTALIAGDLFIISGENVANQVGMGTKLLRVQVYDKHGNIYNTISRSFQTVSSQSAMDVASRWKYNGYIKGESRSESFNSASTWYNNVAAEFNTAYKQWNINASAYLTSEEKSTLQPYNRYSAIIQNGEWLDLRAGDVFPRFPSLIIDGKRVRGISGSLNFGVFNIQASYGETDREVEGSFQRDYANNILFYNSNNVPLGNDIIKIDQSKYGFPYASVNLGTYKRTLFALRPSFGSGENFQFGLSYLHSKDDAGSIEFGARPQENVVIGSDLMFAFDNQNILLTSQVAIDVLNKDISTGSLTDAQIDSVFGNNSNYNIDPKTVKNLRDIIGKFITVNQYLGPWNPQQFSSLAAEGALTLNYFNNSLKTSYIYRGNEFQSFGLSFLRTDVRGLNLVDRFRMLDNKLFVSLGYENLQDNLQNTKIATTTFQTISLSVSIFPRADFPNISLGFNQYNNNNGLSLSDSLKNRNAVYAVDDITDRISLQMSYDFTWRVKHNASISFSTSNRTDNSISHLDSKFNSGTLMLNSYWDPKISSLFALVYSSSSIKGIPFDYLTLTFGGRYKLLEDKLMLSLNLSPSFGDYNRQTFEFFADYNVMTNLNLMLQFRVFRIPNEATNSIVGLIARLSI
jgi:hypothetical protein